MTPGAVADERELAAAKIHELEQAHPGWHVWFGWWTHEYVALHAAVPGLVVAKTAGEMGRRMSDWDFRMRQRA